MSGDSTTPSGRRVLVVTGDPIGEKIAGPAIRAWNISEALSRDNDVTLISLAGVEEMAAPFELAYVSPFDDAGFARHEARADVILFQGHALEFFPSLQRSTKILIADIYDPMHLEQLEQAREFEREIWEERVQHSTTVLNQQLARADFFLCASERQKLFYLGQLAALGRISPATYENDPDFSGLIAVVPFGLQPDFPVADRQVLKGVLPGISVDDKLLIWSGGLYNWFDPATLIRAVGKVHSRHPEVRLFFQGTKHPHPGVPEMAIVAESKRLAAELGLLDVAVFFNKAWVAFADRHNYLSEADAGVSTHFDHIETTMSFRTRILDYLWASLPMAVSDGDVFAELIKREKLGIVVAAEDVVGLADALDRVLYDEEFIAATRTNIQRVREQFFWERVLEPLLHFVAEGRHAGDGEWAVARATAAPLTGPQGPPNEEVATPGRRARLIHAFREGGIRRIGRAVLRRLRR